MFCMVRYTLRFASGTPIIPSFPLENIEGHERGWGQLFQAKNEKIPSPVRGECFLS